MKVEIYKLSELEEKDADKAVEVAKLFAGIKKFKTVPVEVVKKHLEKAGISDVELEGEKVLVGKKKKKGVVYEFIARSEDDDDPLVLIEEGVAAINVTKKIGGKRGSKVTAKVIEEIQNILSDKGDVRLGDVWRALNEKGIIKHRPQLYQIVIKYCNVEYVEHGKRKEIVIKGIKA